MATGSDKTDVPKKDSDKWRRTAATGDVIDCYICSRTLVEPRVLPCMHPFCEECILFLLQSYEKKKKLDRTFPCPVCNKHTPWYTLGKMSPKWLTMFPWKRDIDQMREARVLIEEVCKPCSKDGKRITACLYCEECKTYMCNNCEVNHRKDKDRKLHKVVRYEIREMKNTPVANIAKFQCKNHSSLRYSTYCDTHREFVCNTCRDTGEHKRCDLRNDVIESTLSITQYETKLSSVNSLRRNERNKGRHLIKLIEQIDGIQTTLQRFREKQERMYCKFIMQTTITEQKTEAIDALKGKVEFVKHHAPDRVIYPTIRKVDEILGHYTSLFEEDDYGKASRQDIHRAVGDIEHVLQKGIFEEADEVKTDDTEQLQLYKDPADSHVCKKHVEDSLDEGSFDSLGPRMQSVGALCRQPSLLGSVFRAGSKYVVTAAHVVRDIIDPDRGGVPDYSALEDSSVFVSFVSPPNMDFTRFYIKKKVPFMDDLLNVAVLELDNPDHLPPPLLLDINDRGPPGVPEVAIIGYGHASNQMKHLDIKCPVIERDSQRAEDAYTWLKREERKHRCSRIVVKKDPTFLNWNYEEMADPNMVAVDCCMEYRAHGAPALVPRADSREVDVVGVFTYTVPDCLAEMPTPARKLVVKDYTFQMYTKMSAVYQRISLESRVLADDLFVKRLFIE